MNSKVKLSLSYDRAQRYLFYYGSPMVAQYSDLNFTYFNKKNFASGIRTIFIFFFNFCLCQFPLNEFKYIFLMKGCSG